MIAISRSNLLLTVVETAIIGCIASLISTIFFGFDIKVFVVNFLLIFISSVGLSSLLLHKFKKQERIILKALNDLSSGKHIENVENIDGVLSHAISVANTSISTKKASLNDLLKNLSAVMGEFASALSSTSDFSSQLNDKSNNLSAALAEITAYLNNTVSDTDTNTTAIQTIAAAIEEMSMSINEVSKNCQKEAELAREALLKSENATKKLDTLQKASKDIEKIVETIKGIADQTNLLALNATIEAATAGDAGKGFAVVANEVKELSKQTVRATADISKFVDEIQRSTTETVQDVNDINSVIIGVNSISQTIASAVEEQSSTINEISSSMSKAKESVSKITLNIYQASGGIGEIVGSAEDIKNSTGSISKMSADLDESTAMINELIDKALNEL